MTGSRAGSRQMLQSKRPDEPPDGMRACDGVDAHGDAASDGAAELATLGAKPARGELMKRSQTD